MTVRVGFSGTRSGVVSCAGGLAVVGGIWVGGRPEDSGREETKAGNGSQWRAKDGGG